MDLHVGVRNAAGKAGAGRDRIVVPNADVAPAHPRGIMIAREREMMLGVEPAVIGATEAAEGTTVDHGSVSAGALLLR